MPNKFLPPQTDTATRTASTPIQGEILYDIDENQLYYGDGATTGGVVVGGASAFADLSDVDTTGLQTGQAMVWNGAVWVPGSSSSGREVLTANRTYYVRTDGSDSNDGLTNSAGGAFLTIQKAIDVAATLDISLYTVTIQVADGTYDGKVSLKNYVASGGKIQIRGNALDKTAVVIDYTASTGSIDAIIDADGVNNPWYLGDFTFASTATNRFSLRTWNGSSVIIDKPVKFLGTVGGTHIHCDNYGKCFIPADYEISGSTGRHIFCRVSSTFVVSGSYPITVTLSNSCAFTTTFIGAQRLALVDYWGFTLSGSATGTRADVRTGSVVYTDNTTLPGSATGTTATGGVLA